MTAKGILPALRCQGYFVRPRKLNRGKLIWDGPAGHFQQARVMREEHYLRLRAKLPRTLKPVADLWRPLRSDTSFQCLFRVRAVEAIRNISGSSSSHACFRHSGMAKSTH